MAERVRTQALPDTALAGGGLTVTATRPSPGSPTREGVAELQTLAGNTAARKSLPAASAEPIPSVLDAARGLNIWLHTGNANAHLQEITRMLMLLQDQRVALEAEFERRAGESLTEAIQRRMSGTARVRAQRIHEQGHLDLADEIYFAAKGAGTEEGTLERLLKEASAGRDAVESQFHARYKDDYGSHGELPDKERTKSWIAGMLDSEFSFADEARFKAIYRYGELRAIDDVHLAITGAGTDTDAVFAALAKLSPASAKTEYLESYGGDLEEILTDPWGGELSWGDRDRAISYFKGQLDLVKTVESLIGAATTDEDAIFDAIANAPTTERQKLRHELDTRPMTDVGKRYHGRNSGLDSDDKRRIAALLALPGPDAKVEGAPTAGRDPTAAVVTLLESEGGTSRGAVFTAIKMARPESWRQYRDAYAIGGSAFQHYVDERTGWEEKVGLMTVLSKEPDSLRKRLMWALSGVVSDDEPYLFHLLATFTADETGEGPTRRDLAADKVLLARMDQKLSKGELARARALMRPKDLTPAEAVAWFETDFQRADSWIGRASDSYDALLDARRELRTTFARAQANGEISAEEARRIEQLEVRARASLDVYTAVRDELEGYAVQAITTAVGLLLAVPTGGASVAALAASLARAALFSGVTRLLAEELVRGERFDWASNDGLAAFAGGAAEGITNVVGASVATGLTGPLIKRIEDAGPTVAKIAAGKSFKAFAAAAETATEGAFSGVVTSTVEAAARDETWVNGFEGVVALAKQAPGAAASGAAMAVGTDVAKKAATNAVGRVRKVLEYEPKPPAPAIVETAAKKPPIAGPAVAPAPPVTPNLASGPHGTPDPTAQTVETAMSPVETPPTTRSPVRPSAPDTHTIDARIEELEFLRVPQEIRRPLAQSTEMIREVAARDPEAARRLLRELEDMLERRGVELPGKVLDEPTRELLGGGRTADDEARAAVEEIEGLTTTTTPYVDRFTWQVSEEEAALLQATFPDLPPAGWRTQRPVIMREGQSTIVEQGRTPRGATVPERYHPGMPGHPPVSIEVKNWPLDEAALAADPFAMSDFLSQTVDQSLRRRANLPANAEQYLLIDVRGQLVSQAVRDGIARDLEALSGGVLHRDRIRFLTSGSN